MEAIDSRSRSDIQELEIIVVFEQVPTAIFESIGRIFWKFIYTKESGLLQFWECTPSNSKKTGFNLMLTKQFFMSTTDEGLEGYRASCLAKRYPVVGVRTDVGNWSAGRAAQTGIADHWTKHHVLSQRDEHSEDVGSKGLLVVPVFYGQDAGNTNLMGIIEFVTAVPQESYVDDFGQLENLLKDEGLKSTYIGKTIKVKYGDGNDWIRFTLPLSAKFTDLQKEVKERLSKLNGEDLRGHLSFYTDDTEGNRLPISNDEELQVCIGESSSKGAKLIRMSFVEHMLM